jgi:voltage-gated potassium channel
LWDALSIGLAAVAVVATSYRIAFDPEWPTTGWNALYLIDLFFLLDIGLNFRTSFRSGGEDVVEARRIARHYSLTLLPIDLAATLPLELLGAQIWHSGNQSAFAITLCLNRLLRLVRIVVLGQRLERYSRATRQRVRIGLLVSFMGLLAHCVACGWFASARLDGFPGESWVSLADLTNADTATQYIRSLYWAVVTMTTIGYGDITPGRNVEYLFSIAVMATGASMYAFIIGNLASLLSNRDSSRAMFFQRANALTDYLHRRGAASEVTSGVRGYFDYVWEQGRGYREEGLLADLPTPLRLKVLKELTRDLTATLPLFRHSSTALLDELLLALHVQILAPDVTVIRAGESPQAAYFVGSGELDILSEDERVCYGSFIAGDSFGVLSIVLDERRNATVRTASYCELFVLQREDFERIRSNYSELSDVLGKVAAERGEKLSELLVEGVNL